MTVSVEQYCDITLVDALPENEGILEAQLAIFLMGVSRVSYLFFSRCRGKNMVKHLLNNLLISGTDHG
jgi:hypothetical protein